MAAITPSSQVLKSPTPPSSHVEIYGLDGKIHRLAAVLTMPKTESGDSTKYVAVHIKDQDVYVKFKELRDHAGFSKKDIKNKSAAEVADLIDRHNRIAFMAHDILRSENIGPDSAAIVKFIAVQLKGREDHRKALHQLRIAMKKTSTLKALIYAAKESMGATEYVAKEGGRASLLLHESEIYFGGDVLGEGSYTKVSELEASNLVKLAKAIGRGEKGAASLAKHLETVRKLNALGVPYIPSTHLVSILTKTKKGEEKLVALIHKLDGDGKRIINLNVSPLHVGQVLFHAAIALAGMHGHRMVHSDVKSANILLRGNPDKEPDIDKEGHLQAVGGVLHDFGGAGLAGSDIKIVTKLYAAPEVLAQAATILLPPQDAFSFGVTVLEMASTVRLLQDAPVKIFGEAASDAEIQQRILDLKQKILKAVKNPADPANLQTPLDADDRLLRIKLLDIAAQLLHIDPNNRISMRAAADLLQNTLKTHLDDIDQGLVDQKLQEIEDSLLS